MFVIDGAGFSLNAVIRDRKYEAFGWDKLVELEAQLEDASVKASRPVRREFYGTQRQVVVHYVAATYPLMQEAVK